MKKLFCLIVFTTTIFSCSNTDVISENQIIGEWKLIEAKIPKAAGVNSSTGSIDYSNNDIIYNFKSNNILTVSGGTNVGYPNGNYDYFWGEDYLSTTTDPKILLVKINESKWIYNLINEKMILEKSYIDGPDLVFERI